MSFASDIEKWANKTKQKVDDIVVAAALEIGGTIIMRTPVDTGRAKNNWQFSIGVPDLDSIRGNSRNGSGANRQLEQVAIRAPGEIFWITNNLPYVYYLEYGNTSTAPFGASKQAPRGMFRRTIKQYQSIVRRKARG